MTLTLNKNYFKRSIENIADLIERERDHLTELDSEIGDGDHGINMSIGFRDVTKNLESIDEQTEDIETFLKKVGMSLLGKVGGASGPLYGSFFMKMGKPISGKTEVTFEEWIQMIESGVKSIEIRGKSEVGQKTMVDAFRPAIDFLKEQTIDNNEEELFEEFVEVMKNGADKTIDLIAKKGRSARLGERAVGHKDPGAESAWMIMNAFSEELKKT